MSGFFTKTVVPVMGTIATWGLDEYSKVAAIAASIATFVWICWQVYLSHKREQREDIIFRQSQQKE